MHAIYNLRLAPDRPAPPTRFSFSSLKQIEQCPRQWWFLHSRLVEWGGEYPRRLTPSLLTGQIVHAVLQQFSEELRKVGNPSYGSATYRRVREEFGLRARTLDERSRRLKEASNNARADTLYLQSQVLTDLCIDSFKLLTTQAYSGATSNSSQAPRSPVLPTSPSGSPSTASLHARVHGAASRRLPTIPVPATLPEYRVESAKLPLVGIIDLVATDSDGDTIVEFKTGEPRVDHEEQTAIYAMLWFHETDRLVRARKIVYANGETISLPGLEVDQISALTCELAHRVTSATTQLEGPNPTANPGAVRCAYCDVRQCCSDYWVSTETENLRWNLQDIPIEPDRKSFEGSRDIEVGLEGAEALQTDLLLPLPQSGPETSSSSSSPRVHIPVLQRFYPGPAGEWAKLRLLNVGLRSEQQRIRVLLRARSELFWG